MKTVRPNAETGNDFSSDASEKRALGTLLNYPDQLHIAVQDGLEPLHFFAPHHEAIFAAMLDLHSRSEEITPQSVVARMSLQNTAVELAAAPFGEMIPFLTALPYNAFGMC